MNNKLATFEMEIDWSKYMLRGIIVSFHVGPNIYDINLFAGNVLKYIVI